MAGGGTQSSPSKGGAMPYGSNPYQNASQGMSGAFNQLQQAGAVNQAALPITAQGYNPAMQGGASPIYSQMGNYENPYQQQVLDTTMQDIARTRDINLNNVQGQAANAGAFGGARHGLVEGEVYRDAGQQMANTGAQIRNQGFMNAAGLAGQDIGNQLGVAGANQGAMNQAGQFNVQNRNQAINDYFARAQSGAAGLGNLAQGSFGMGQDITQQQMQQGALAQMLQQQLLTGGQGMYDQYLSQPQQLLNLRLQSLGVNPLNNAGSTTQSTEQKSSPMDIIGPIASIAGMFLMSDADIKKDITPTGKMARSRRTGKTVPVYTFRYKEGYDHSKGLYEGVLAHELAKVDPEAVVFENGRPMAVNYGDLEIV